jgi:hypothetical protein
MMFYPVPYEYHEFIVDRRDPRPQRLLDELVARKGGRRAAEGRR